MTISQKGNQTETSYWMHLFTA